MEKLPRKFEDATDKYSHWLDEFTEVYDRLTKTYIAKNADYGNSFTECYKKFGKAYAYGHIWEKMKRIESLRNQDAQVKGESIIDSLMDLANYCILTIMEMERLFY